MSLKKELLQHDDISRLQGEYKQAGIPFTGFLNKGIKNAVRAAGVTSPEVQDVAAHLIWFLTDTLRRKLAATPPKTRAGRVIRWLLNAAAVL